MATEEKTRKYALHYSLRTGKKKSQTALPTRDFLCWSTLVKKMQCQILAIRNVTATKYVYAQILNTYYIYKDESIIFKFSIPNTYFVSFLWL